MRLAWFRPAAADSSDDGVPPSNDTALLIRALRAQHTIELIDRARAHDFVWQHARDPFDMCVFELGGTPEHQFVAAYAVHYPGIVLLRGLPRYERAIRAARLVVVSHEPVAQALADDYPGARIRTLTPGVEPLPLEPGSIVTALRWPPDAAALSYALSGFAARCAVVVFDGPETADWPSLDPQNWQVRGETPICVSLDPRDEAHSLRLARRRLEQDARLRRQLGEAAHAWWLAHATVAGATRRFEQLLDEARQLPAAAPAEADEGMELARRLLADFGTSPEAIGLRS